MLLEKLKTRKMMLFMVFSEVSYATQAMLIKKKNGGCKKSLYYFDFFTALSSNLNHRLYITGNIVRMVGNSFQIGDNIQKYYPRLWRTST